MIDPLETCYIDADTGYELKYIDGNGDVRERVHGCIFFAEWMLALTDNFNFEVRTHFMYYFNVDDVNKTNMTSEDYIISTYKVIGRDKTNNRECFKVEVDNNGEKSYYCIDVEKRIALEAPFGDLIPEDDLTDL